MNKMHLYRFQPFISLEVGLWSGVGFVETGQEFFLGGDWHWSKTIPPQQTRCVNTLYGLYGRQTLTNCRHLWSARQIPGLSMGEPELEVWRPGAPQALSAGNKTASPPGY